MKHNLTKMFLSAVVALMPTIAFSMNQNTDDKLLRGAAYGYGALKAGNLLGTIIHEYGHAYPLKSLLKTPYQMHIGCVPRWSPQNIPLYQGKKVTFHLGTLLNLMQPVGFISTEMPQIQPHTKLKHVAVYAGGPIAQYAFGCCVLYAAYKANEGTHTSNTSYEPPFLQAGLAFSGLFQIAGAMQNLIPYKESDGFQICRDLNFSTLQKKIWGGTFKTLLITNGLIGTQIALSILLSDKNQSASQIFKSFGDMYKEIENTTKNHIVKLAKNYDTRRLDPDMHITEEQPQIIERRNAITQLPGRTISSEPFNIRYAINSDGSFTCNYSE